MQEAYSWRNTFRQSDDVGLLVVKVKMGGGSLIIAEATVQASISLVEKNLMKHAGSFCKNLKRGGVLWLNTV